MGRAKIYGMGVSRKVASKNERTAKQVELAQYFTSDRIAKFMASLFDDSISSNKKLHLLDPGAGKGVLGLSVIERYMNTHEIDANFVELDHETSLILKKNLEKISKSTSNTKCYVVNEDFIDIARDWYSYIKRFSHIIINPPYFKIRTNSDVAKKLHREGVLVTNIYAAFLWLSIKLLEENGQLVAIVPRSFCNGPYFLKFREYGPLRKDIQPT